MTAEDKPGRPKQPSPERSQTDESLRRERAKVDDAIGVTFNALEQLADAVIEQARGRADAVLAAARAKEDRQNAGASARSAGILARTRAREDAVLRRERAEADELVRAERAEQSVHLSTLRNYTDSNLLEERACADDAVAARDDFLGIVSHDLRNMLSSVLAFASLIERANPEKQSDMVRLNAQRIKRSVARMGRLVGDLVDVASIEADTLAVRSEVGDPAKLVLEVVDTFQTQAAEAGVTLVADVISPLPLVSFDPARILQVLTNLLINAIKFTPPNGRVVVLVDRSTMRSDLESAIPGRGSAPTSSKRSSSGTISSIRTTAAGWGSVCTSPAASSRGTTAGSGSRASSARAACFTSRFRFPPPLSTQCQNIWPMSM
jgi:signal transduction histidine kinase